MGAGAYGLVVAALDTEANEEDGNVVAIKKFENMVEHTITMQRTLRELIILRLLDHENIMSLKTIVIPPN